MKTAIIYTSKYGTTEKVSHIIAEKIKTSNQVTLIYLQDFVTIDLSTFDQIILGTPIYAGNPYWKMKQFCLNKKRDLENKTVSLFVCGMEQQEEKKEKELKEAFPDYLQKIATTKTFIRGELNFDKMKFVEKIVMHLIGKSKSAPNGLEMGAIQLFSEKIKNQILE